MDELSEHELESVAVALADGRLSLPVSEFTLQRLLGRVPPPRLSSELAELLAGGPAALLRMLARRKQAPVPELVWSGPDETRSLRATAVVVEDLFERAQQRVLVAGFAVVQGGSVFRVLAQRLDANESLSARIVLNVHDRRGFESDLTIVLFAEQFWRDWPGQRRPTVFYDPRSLLPQAERAVMHAKCVVADGTAAFVTSANFTPHAQRRNVELGVLIEQPVLAAQIERQFELLVARGHLLRLPE